MIDLEHEHAVPLSDAPRHPLLRRGRREGRPIHRATLERWRTRGVRGIVLESLLCGGIRMTTTEAIERFFGRLNDPNYQSGMTTKEIAREHALAEKQLEAEGM
jgi:Protein of unknown function (DUF1580)